MNCLQLFQGVELLKSPLKLVRLSTQGRLDNLWENAIKECLTKWGPIKKRQLHHVHKLFEKFWNDKIRGGAPNVEAQTNIAGGEDDSKRDEDEKKITPRQERVIASAEKLLEKTTSSQAQSGSSLSLMRPGFLSDSAVQTKTSTRQPIQPIQIKTPGGASSSQHIPGGASSSQHIPGGASRVGVTSAGGATPGGGAARAGVTSAGGSEGVALGSHQHSSAFRHSDFRHLDYKAAGFRNFEDALKSLDFAEVGEW